MPASPAPCDTLSIHICNADPYDRATFFGGTVAGYTDYPFHAELRAA